MIPRGEIASVLEDVQSLKAMLIQVGTGERRIQDAEAEYMKLRGKVASGLRAFAIADPNAFHSLWDWYGYWRNNGLSSYQSRRDYVNSSYKCVIDALESISVADAVTTPEREESLSFSVRHGYAPDGSEAGITIREEAPAALRQMVIDIATRSGWGHDGLFNVASRIGKQSWEASEPRQSGLSVRVQLERMISDWPWYQVYDFVEQVYSAMRQWEIFGEGEPDRDFERMLNDYFCFSGVGWQLRDGTIISRGSESFEAAIRRVLPVIQETHFQTAQREIHEALSDLSHRPVPDLTGAIQHAMAALECVARKVSGDPNPTLGKLLERHPGLVPKPLDSAVEKAWGYASERGRHIREGEEPSREDAELIVGIAATVATFLCRKLPK
jgi:hypothetical protein